MQRALPIATAGGLALAGTARARGTETHGRWPWVSAIAAPPAAVATLALRDRFPGVDGLAVGSALPLLLAHQTEEWVIPGGFLEWFNHSVWRSSDPEFPVTRPIGFRINVIFGWGFTAAAWAAGRRAPWLSAAVLTTNVGNALLHGARAAVERRYNPGLVTGAAMGSLGVAGTAAVVRRGGRAELAGVALGVAMSIGTVVGLSLRARGRRRR